MPLDTPPFPPPIVILAPPGLQGQTLAAALGRHPLAYDLPELNLEQMATIEVLRRELSGLRAPQLHGLMRAIAHLYAGEQSSAAVEMAGRWLMRRAYLPTEAVAYELAQRISPRRMVLPVTASLFDKGSLRRLRATYPTARYVLLQCHPHVYGRMVWADSNSQAMLMLTGAVDETTDPPTPDPQELWLTTEVAMEIFVEDMPKGQVIRQSFEDLVTDPATALAALAGSLDMPATPGTIGPMLHPEASVFAGPGPMGAHLPGQISPFATLARALPDRATATLQGPLPWRTDGAGFRKDLAGLAEAQGYA